jgi:hypothetical protein
MDFCGNLDASYSAVFLRGASRAYIVASPTGEWHEKSRVMHKLQLSRTGKYPNCNQNRCK